MNYALVIVSLILIILAHELGHFVAARVGGMPVKKFSVGFGPKIISRTIKGTEYILSLIPLGGYVLLDVESPDDYYRHSLLRRIFYAVSGSLANIALTIFCFYVIAMMSGTLFAPEGWKVPWMVLVTTIGEFISAISVGFTDPDNLLGIVGIVSEGGTYIGASALRFFSFTAMISLNLAIINLLPVPPLDGGRILMDVTQSIFPRSVKLHVPLQMMGFVSLICLFLYVTVSDILRLVL